MIQTHGQQDYCKELGRQGVDPYESTPGATVESTVRGIAEDLGIVRGTVRHRLEARW